MLLLLVILILVFGLGGNFYSGGQYRGAGFGLGGILLLLVLFMLFSGGGFHSRLGW